MSDIADNVDVLFEERREGRPVTVRVVPLKYVLWVASVLFVLWNIVGFPLLDYYLTRKFAEHNRDSDAHIILVNGMATRLLAGDVQVATELKDINERLSRIEGRLQITKQ